MDETLVYFGDAVKALGDGRVGGYLVRFSDASTPDLYGEFFTRSTDFDIEDGDSRSVYYHHGMDDRMGRRKIGRATLKMDEFGVWVEAQLAMRDEYERAIYEMCEQGKMGWSSGAISHLVEVEPVGKAGWIKFWPLGEASLTPTPAEPRNTAMPLKALLDAGSAPHSGDAQAIEAQADPAQRETRGSPTTLLRARGYLMSIDED